MARFLRDILETLSYDAPAAPVGETTGPVAMSRLDERLAGFVAQGAGQRETIRIEPQQCAVWDGNPRDVPGLTAENCRSLIESIAAENGNRIPVLIRQNGADAKVPYELLVGSRRRFAVDWLNRHGRPDIRLYALIVDLTDEEAFRLADIENRERSDITELDRARSYQAAVDRFYGGVQSRMAQALSLSNSQLSRLIALALLPAEVVAAFATKDDIRVRHSEILTPLLRRPDERQRIMAAAIAIGAEQRARDKPIAPAAVLARLRTAATPRGADGTEQGAIMVNGARVGRLKTLKTGGIAIELTLADDIDVDQLLAEVRQAVDQARAMAEPEMLEAAQ